MITPLDILKSKLSKLDLDLRTKIETNALLNIINLFFIRRFNFENNLINRSELFSEYINEFIQIEDLSEFLLNNNCPRIKKIL